MGVKIVILYLLKLLILLLSLGTLGCHVAQLILLNQMSGTGQWWPGYVPYTLYYVGTIVSILSATVLLLIGCIFTKSLWGDRITSIINLLLFVAIIVYNSLMSGTIPWTGSVSKSFSSSMKGWVTYCPSYSDSNTSIRCWLTNGTWLGMVVVGFLWLLLMLYSFILKKSDVYADDYDTYDFKEDVPMAKTITNSTAAAPMIGGPELPKHNSAMHPYMIANRDFHNQSQETYYYSTQGTPVYDFNNSDIYMNPIAEDHNMYKATSPLQNEIPPQHNGFERQRKLSKTYYEDDELDAIHHSGSPSTEYSQPPHTYEGQQHAFR